MLEFVLLGNAKYAIGDHCQRVQPLEFRGGQKIDCCEFSDLNPPGIVTQ